MMPKTPDAPVKREAQRQAFIKAAHEAGCSEDEAEFDANLKRVATAKPSATPKASLEQPDRTSPSD